MLAAMLTVSGFSWVRAQPARRAPRQRTRTPTPSPGAAIINGALGLARLPLSREATKSQSDQVKVLLQVSRRPVPREVVDRLVE